MFAGVGGVGGWLGARTQSGMDSLRWDGWASRARARPYVRHTSTLKLLARAFRRTWAAQCFASAECSACTARITCDLERGVKDNLESQCVGEALASIEFRQVL